MNRALEWLDASLPVRAAGVSERSRRSLLAGARRDLLQRTYIGTFVYPVVVATFAWLVGLFEQYPITVTALTTALAVIVIVRVALVQRALADVNHSTVASRVHVLLGIVSAACLSAVAGVGFVFRDGDAATTGGFVVVVGLAASIVLIASTHRTLAFVWMIAVQLPGAVGFVVQGSEHALVMLSMFALYTLILRKMIVTTHDSYWDAQIAAARLDDQAHAFARLSRATGMAENATNVLHDVGNTLNAVGTSVAGLAELQKAHPAEDLRRVADLLAPHTGDLPRFFAEDPRGAKLVPFLVALAESAQTHADATGRDVVRLRGCVQHIETIVRRQQEVAKGVEAPEPCAVDELVRGALGLCAVGSGTDGITIDSAIDTTLAVQVDRHRAMQILVNLLENARDALAGASITDPTIRIAAVAVAQDISILIEDNGCGITPEHAARIFSRGFTTKSHGHGFGLHGGFVLAQAMGGELSFVSRGADRGACFRLRLPAAPPGSGLPADAVGKRRSQTENRLVAVRSAG